jgi:hypothetical protein
MGAQLCGMGMKILSQHVQAPDSNDDEDYPDGVPTTNQGGNVNVYMVCIALDYKGTGNELTCTKDGDNMMDLWQQCGMPAQNVKKLFDNDGNKDAVTQAVRELGGQCNAGDYFIFYYSGHGTSVPDKDGDEEDGKDEALCLVTPDGKIDWSSFMTDDELADLLTSSLQDGVKTIILADCCHSGTISDFSSSGWGAIKACSISGCTDSQTSGDTGNGGIFTHSLLMAIGKFVEDGTTSYSLGQLYNSTLEFDDSVFDSKQDITCACSDALSSPTGMAWPLIPDSYTAPMSQ